MIIETNADLLLTGHPATTLSEIAITDKLRFVFKKMRFKISSAECRPFCLESTLTMKCKDEN